MHIGIARRLAGRRALITAVALAGLTPAAIATNAQASSRFPSAPTTGSPVSLKPTVKPYEDVYDSKTGLLYVASVTGTGAAAHDVIKVIYTSGASATSTDDRYTTSSGAQPAAGTVVDTIQDSSDQVLGLAIDPADNLLYGSGTRSSDVVAWNIDPASGNADYDQIAWRTTFVAGQDGVGAASNVYPRDMTLGAGTYANDLYATIPFTNQVVDLNATTGAINKVLSAQPSSGVLDSEARTTAVIFDPDNDMLYAANCETCDESPDGTTSGTVSEIDPSAAGGSSASTVISGLDLQPVNLAYDSATKQIYVTAQGSDLHNGKGTSDGYVDVIDANAADDGTNGAADTYNTVVNNIDLGSEVDPLGIAYDGASNVVYVTEYGAVTGGDVAVFDGSTDVTATTAPSLLDSVDVGAQPLHVALDTSGDDDIAYVTDQGSNAISEIKPGVSSAGLTVSPSTVAPGGTVTLAGTGFTAGETVTITVGGQAATTTPATVTADSDGSFSATFTVPSGLSGTETVTAADTSGDSASRTLEVSSTSSTCTTPTITDTPTSVAAGGTVTISGCGFESGQVIQAVKFDDGAVIGGGQNGSTPFATADSGGSFSGTVTIPSGTSAGSHTLTELGSTPAAVSQTQTITVTGASASVRSDAIEHEASVEADTTSTFGVSATISLATTTQAYQDAYDSTTGLLYDANVGEGVIDVIYTKSATAASTNDLYTTSSGSQPAAGTIVARIPVATYGLTINSRTNRLLADNDAAGVTDIINIDPTSSHYDQTVASFAIRARSATADTRDNLWFVAEPHAGAVAEIDGETNTIVKTIATGGTTPTSVAYDPDNGLLYVTNLGSGTVAVIDPGTRSVVEQITVPSPIYAAYDPLSKQVLVADDGAGTVSAIDVNAASPTDNTVVKTVNVGATPLAVAIDANDGLAYVVNYKGASVSVLDAYSDDMLWTVGVGNQPLMAAIDPTTDTAYVANQADDTIEAVDPASATAIVETTTSLSVSPGGDALAGAAVTLTANVTGGTTGTVTFYDGATALGSVDLSGGSASLTTSSLSAGVHVLQAVYSSSDDGIDSSLSNAVQYLVESQGANGTNGSTGSRGPAGPAGPQGATGAQGPAGPQGKPGKNGTSGTVTLKVAAKRVTVRRGHVVTLRLTLVNKTTAKLSRVTASVTPSKALRAGAKRSVSIAPLKVGAHGTVSVRLHVGRAAKLGTDTVKITLRIGHKLLTETVKVRVVS